MIENENVWSKNQYIEGWTSITINDALQNILNKPQLKGGFKNVPQRRSKAKADVKQ